MNLLLRRLAVALLTVSLLPLTFAADLTPEQRAKVHPAFLTLLTETSPEHVPPAGSTARPAKAIAPDGTALYDAIVHVLDPQIIATSGVRVLSRFPGFVTTRLTVEQILRLVRTEGVTYIDPGSVNYPTNDVSIPETGASLLQGGFINGVPYRGSGAIVLLYDTGIDWKHMDFRVPADPTKSRIVAIWDQTLTPTLGEHSPSAFGYGVEYLKSDIDAELASPQGKIREKDINGHGTHVCGTAAGNGPTISGKFTGMAPEADIIVVKGGDQSFDETKMIDGLTYAENMATSLGKPIAVNWSIGSHSGPHDGSRAYEIAINTFVSKPGRVVAVAAGNQGADPIHVGGTLAGGLTTITFTVPTYTATPGVGNNQFAFDLWLNGQPTTVAATAISPNGYSAAVQYSGSTSFANGNSVVDGVFSLYQGPSSTPNGALETNLWVRDDGVNYPRAGSWKLTLNNTGAPVHYDGWLYLESVGTGSVTVVGGDVNETVGMPATAEGAISVGSYGTKWSWPSYVGSQYGYVEADRTNNISSFSSLGPTRDGRQKPDIAAPGQGIASSLSADADTTGGFAYIYPDQLHIISQGTSMATPHVAGGAALILGAYPSATALEIKSLIASMARTDSYTGTAPNLIWGYGKLDILGALAKKVSSSAVVTRALYAYDGAATNALVTLTGFLKSGVRISPTVSGQLTGLTLNLTTPTYRPVRGTGDLVCEVYSDNAGIPGTKIGSSVAVPLKQLSAGTINYIQMLGAAVNVTAGTDVHLVVSLSSPADTLVFRTENVGTGTRSSSFSGSWAAAPTNHRLRAIVTTASGLSSVEPLPGLPLSYELSQNYPNPFNPSTRISYSIGAGGYVSLKVFDILGRDISTLVGEVQQAGSYQITWNGTDGRGIPVTSGVYFYRLESGAYARTVKMILLR